MSDKHYFKALFEEKYIIKINDYKINYNKEEEDYEFIDTSYVPVYVKPRKVKFHNKYMNDCFTGKIFKPTKRKITYP
jgi:hypothetical protein